MENESVSLDWINWYQLSPVQKNELMNKALESPIYCYDKAFTEHCRMVKKRHREMQVASKQRRKERKRLKNDNELQSL